MATNEVQDRLDTEVHLVEVCPRDGLQNERRALDPATRIEFIDRLIDAGHRRIESVSFVSATRVPQMAGPEAVMAGVKRVADDGEPVRHIGLVLSRTGVDRAIAAKVDEANIVIVATDTFSERNQGVSVNEMISIAADCVREAKIAGLRTTVTVAAAFGCPFEGEVSDSAVARIAAAAADMGVDELALADTIGVGVPRDVHRLVELVRPEGDYALRVHLHNTRNTGYANALAAIDAGVTAIDSSAGGFGGCPFAPAATGNIATEDVLYALQRSDIDVGLSVDDLIAPAIWIADQLGADHTPGLVARAGNFPAAD